MADDFARLSMLRVTTQLLCEALHLPGGTEILDARMEDFQTLKFKVSHPDFPKLETGDPIPPVTVMVTVHFGERRDGFESKWSGPHLEKKESAHA